MRTRTAWNHKRIIIFAHRHGLGDYVASGLGKASSDKFKADRVSDSVATLDD